MRIYITILLIKIFAISVFAQLPKITIDGNPILLDESFEERRDINGRLCAVIKVISKMEGFAYDAYNGIVGDVIDKQGEDIIYLQPDEQVFMVFRTGYEPIKIIFSEIGIQLTENQIWKIQIKGLTASLLPVSFIINPSDVNISINGRSRGSGPTFQLYQGEYMIKLEKKGYLSLLDTILVNESHILFNYQLVIQPEMAFVRGGMFEMGDTFGDGVNFNEKPVHKVILSSFEIGKTEITQSQWVRYMEYNPSKFKGANLPVEQVTWYEVVEFCNKMSELSGLTPCYTVDKTLQDPNIEGEYDTYELMQ